MAESAGRSAQQMGDGFYGGVGSMKVMSRIREHRKTVASVASLSVLSIAVTTMAVLYQGITTADVDLNDGGVWVTKPTALQLGHLNYPSQVLDSGLKAASNDFDVLQSGDTVLLEDRANTTLSIVDPALTLLDGDAQLPADSDVALGGPTVAVLDRAAGALFSLTPDQVDGFVADGAEPVAKVGSDARIAVSSTGSVFAVGITKDDTIVATSITMSPTGALEAPEKRELGDAPEGAALSIAAIGDGAVVFEASTGTIYRPGGGTTVVQGAEGGVLQQSGPASDDVLIQTADTLITQPIDGGKAAIDEADATGTAIAPVRLGTCAYAAWAGSGSYIRDCDDDADDQAQRVDGLDPASSLTFRVNRSVIVLNDLDTGAVWLVNQDMKKVDNWDDLTPPPGESDDETDEESTEETLENTLPERSETNTPPTAEDDTFGVRPGRSTILPVLDNDNDPDGDLLTAEVSGDQPSIGRVDPVFAGGSLQIDVPSDASGTASFAYTADDGRGGRDTATVTVAVRAPGTNEAPASKRNAVILVEQGRSIDYNVLTDWIDPDGDDLFLRSAAPTSDDEVQFRADGVVSFSATGLTIGRKQVAIVVSDGTDDTEGVLTVDVRERGTAKPIANGDHVTTVVDQPVTVAPLANDLSPSGAPLRLARVDDVQGATIEADYAAGTFTFTAATAGDYYGQYLATDGPNTAIGYVRITVDDVSSENRPPVAVRDVARLPQGRDVLVDVLANDVDPSGGVLVVQSVDVSGAPGLTVAVLDHNILRITDQPGITEQVTLGYTVSNGISSANGQVVVTPVPAPSDIDPPIAVDDTVTVRAGDIATINVLANDKHPNGDALILSPTLVEPLVDPADGDLFVSENTLRFKAGPTAKTVYATYEVVDTLGQRDGGYVTIQIIAPDEGTNSPPRPENVQARALAGASIRIPIPLDGIDPDGDSVELVGQASAPRLGRVTGTGATWIDYEADADAAGTDSFSYTVRDRLGATATGSVLVGVAPKAGINQAPYAVKDAVTVRPSRTVAVPVLANDSDPDGDTLTLLSDGLVVPDGIEAEVVDDRVLVRTGPEATELTLQYTVADGFGATAVSTVLVTVTPDAPLLQPIARDDTIALEDIDSEQTVDVDVLANDEDPDGVPSELGVTVDDPTATVDDDGLVTVTLTPEPRILDYTVTDIDGLTGKAFIIVPGLDSLRPTLNPDAAAVTVRTGETIDLALGDYVSVGTGKTARLTESALVYATHSDGASLVADATTLRYTSAAGYYGQDALTFEVTDGTGPEDPNGHKATLSIAITVLPPENEPPTFAGGSMQVVPGEAASVLDLRALSADPNEGDLDRLSYEVSGAPTGLTAGIDGSVLSVSADASTPKGTTASLSVTVSDGVAPPVEGAVEVSVTSSTRPLPRAVDDVFPRADQGEPLTVDVLSNDFNPFPETPLTVLSAAVEGGDGTATVQGGSVIVTPGPDMVGALTVTYRIQDATADVDRQAQGTIRVTVQGRPEAPGRPGVTTVQDRTVVLSWTPPQNNGSEITGYTLSTNDGKTQQCASTTCTFGGLTNDVTYTFTVTATNAVGTSEPSGASAEARPDVRPSPPGRPELTFGDQKLEIEWAPAESLGSPVTDYVVEISPAPLRGPLQQKVQSTSMVWENLQNGTSYTVRVQAVNKAPDPSEWSARSAPMVPAGVPDAVGAPTAKRVETELGGQIDISWTAPKDNGDAISEYTVTIYKNGSKVGTTPGSQTLSQTVGNLDVNGDYTFTVVARNKAGLSPEGAPSAAQRPFGKPADMGSVQLSRLASQYSDGALAVSFAAPAFNGDDASYQIQTSSGSTLASGLSWGSGQVSNTISGLTNGTSYAIQVRACNDAGCGGWSAPSGSASPFGPLKGYSVATSGDGGGATWSWDFSGMLNGQTLSSATRSGAGIDKAGSYSEGGFYYSSKTMDFSLTTAEGNSWNQSATIDGRQNPARGVTVSKGAKNYAGDCAGSVGCNYLDGEIRGMVPNASVSVGCYYTRDGGDKQWNTTFQVQLDGNGNGSWSNQCFVGPDSANVWTAPYFAKVTDGAGTETSNKNQAW